jgi:protein SCO1/2
MACGGAKGHVQEALSLPPSAIEHHRRKECLMVGLRWLLPLALAAASAPPLEGAQFKGGALDPPRPAPEISLRNPEGSTFRLSAYRGKVVVLSFGYTFCPDVCPMTLSELAQVRTNLGEAARRVQVAFITVDPERDTPARLAEYTRYFDKTFVGLTGTPEQLAQVRKAYGATAEKRAVPGTSAAYLIDHSAFIYVIDVEGRLRLMFPFGTPVEDMTHDIQLLLRR